jgi:hypothetical protein
VPRDDGRAKKTQRATAGRNSPQELEDHIKVQLGKWKTMVDDAGIQPE